MQGMKLKGGKFLETEYKTIEEEAKEVIQILVENFSHMTLRMAGL